MHIPRAAIFPHIALSLLLTLTPLAASAECGATELRLSIPYLWTGKPVGREAEAMFSQVSDDLHTAITDQAGLANWDEAIARVQILSVKLTGFASPESLKGPDSIRPENVDPVNKRVGERRARTLAPAVQSVLAELGLRPDALSTHGDERQFTQGEWRALHQIATGKESAGIIDVPAVYQLLNRLKRRPDSFEAAQLNALQPVLADKKSVDVTICYQQQEASTDDNRPSTPDTPTKKAAEEPTHAVKTPSESIAPRSRETLPRTPLKGQQPEPVAPKTAGQKPQQGAPTGPFSAITGADGSALKSWPVENLPWIIGTLLALAALVFVLFRLTDRLADNTPVSHKARTSRRRPWAAQGPRMLAVMSGKGGTGKSSISSSLAYGLAHLGYKTLLVDVDLFTHGLTVLNQPALDSEDTCVPLKSIFDQTEDGAEPPLPTPVAVKTRFTGDNLFVLPSIPLAEVDLDAMPMTTFEPLELPAPHNETKPFAEQLKRSLEQVCTAQHFDYVVLDTRGGADHTSVGAALAATAFVLVSEADKPSWAISDRLLDTIYAVRAELDMKTRPLGFIINKNALPADSIETHLAERWEMKHLGTLPYDIAVVRCFEKARIPMAEERHAGFSEGIMALIRRLDHARAWD